MTQTTQQQSLKRTFFLFSLPFLFSYFLQTLYGMADLLIMGQFGSTADVTAVSIGSQVMHMVTVMIVGLLMGSTVSIAHAWGAGQKEEVRKAFGTTVLLCLLLSVLLIVLLCPLAGGITSLLGTPAEAAAGCSTYLLICFAGLPFIIFYNMAASVLRGIGDSKTPMFFVIAACLLNIGLDLLFMGPMHLGPAGAALGTTLSQAFSVLLAVLYLLRKDRQLLPAGSEWKPERNLASKILRVGFPVCLQDGLIQIAFLLITVIANSRGLVDSAAVGITEKFISFVFLVPSSLLSTVSALGAQKIGAGQPREAVSILRIALSAAIVFGLSISLLMQVLAPYVISLFSRDPAVITAGGTYLRGYIWDALFAGLHFSFSGYFCAIGKSWLSFIQNSVSAIFFRVPGAWLMSRLFPSTLYPMGLATAFSSLVSVLICLLLYHFVCRKSAESVPESEEAYA